MKLRNNMPHPTYQLAYLSQRVASVTDEEIVDRIVLPAMTKNRSVGVTGCLWFDDKFFFQIIEGPEETIDVLFATIETDDRHSSVQLLYKKHADVRQFARFGMRAAHSNSAQSMPSLIAAVSPGKPPHAASHRRWNPLSRAKPRAEQKGPTNLTAAVTDLARTIAHELADWSDATPT